MPINIHLTLSPKQASDKETYIRIAASIARIKRSDITFARVVRRSIDARRSVKVNMTVELYIDNEPMSEPAVFEFGDVSNGTEVVIVGSGPAGLFAALRLIESGYKPIILERGREVSARKRDIARINRNLGIDPDSNYSFGEGGAGTFSDGKLFTRSKKRGDCDRIIRLLVHHGADPGIIYDAHPHIGSDKLPRIISAIRQTITDAGGKMLFGCRVTDIELKEGRIKGVWCGDELIEGAAVILATGHSASDIYEMLHRRSIRLEAKPFAMGVRVEHQQALIDSIQYHMPERGEYLPAASYSLVTQAGGRGVYSFCMCPGGFIVPAMTASDESVVNGMSPSGRNSVFANSGIVTEIRIDDFAPLCKAYGGLAGLKFRQQFEHIARLNGGEAQMAPGQRLADFVHGKASSSLPATSYHPGAVPSEMVRWMPEFISEPIRRGLSVFGAKMQGFLTNEALVLGVESRTSTPVRIPRDPNTLEHIQIKGLFPAGEGAGYAGGIVSAALDGERVAEAVDMSLKN